MKNQALFSLKDKSKKLKCRLQQFLFGALRVKRVKSELPFPTLYLQGKAGICQLIVMISTIILT